MAAPGFGPGLFKFKYMTDFSDRPKRTYQHRLVLELESDTMYDLLEELAFIRTRISRESKQPERGELVGIEADELNSATRYKFSLTTDPEKAVEKHVERVQKYIKKKKDEA